MLPDRAAYSTPAVQYSLKRVLVCSGLISLILFVDRGIIPGAASEFNAFIKSSLGVQDPDAYLGLLTSLFVGGFAVAGPYFGQKARSKPPFELVGWAMVLFILSAVVSGLAKPLMSYYLLAVGRVISGVGEAAVLCIVPAFIDEHAPEEKRASWLALYMTSMPVGMAVGYGASSIIAASKWHWGWTFFAEAIAMAPLALYCLAVRVPAPRRLSQLHQARSRVASLNADTRSHRSASTASSVASALSASEELTARLSEALLADDPRSSDGVISSSSGAATGGGEKPPKQHLDDDERLVATVRALLREPVFLLISFGYASYQATLQSMSTFGPDETLALGFFDDERGASSVFGVLVAVGGMVGTPLGGKMLDYGLKGTAGRRTALLRRLALLLFVVMCLFAGVAAAKSKTTFLILVGLGTTGLCACVSGVLLALMLSSPKETRPLALGVATLICHALGDVPVPPALGEVKDWLAPHCDVPTSAACEEDEDGLRWTMLICGLWLGWGVLTWGLASVMSGQEDRRFPGRHWSV